MRFKRQEEKLKKLEDEEVGYRIDGFLILCRLKGERSMQLKQSFSRSSAKKY